MSSQHSSSAQSAQNGSSSDSGAMDNDSDNDSDAGSASSTNDEGYDFFEQNQRLVLFHPLGLPLVAAFHGSVLANLPLAYPVEAFPPEIGTNEKGNTILSEVVGALTKDSITEMDAPKLTTKLRDKIKLAFADQFRVETETRTLFDGRKYGECMDLTLFSKPRKEDNSGADTPLCVVQVGLSSDDWWTKFYQGCSDLHLMQQKPDEQLCFNKPLLLAIITLNGDTMRMGADHAASHDIDFCMGVFLCTPTNEASDFRMSLIWHKWHPALEDASMSFGLLLRIMDHFQTQRSKEYSKEVYEYFSSTCVKAGDKVLRVYDSIFLPSKRGADFYLDPKCNDIVGGAVKKVLEIPEPFAAPANNNVSQDDDPRWRKTFFDESPCKTMLVITTPFREGQHVAQHPSDFLPIIEHLERIHPAGFVHGDIRASNTVFPNEEGGPGYLIDFCVSGIAGQVHYPAGYVRNLDDGERFAFREEKIKKWHDWYALGRLMFRIHHFYPQPEGQFTRDYYECSHNWTHVETDPSPDDIHELKSFLSELQRIGWTVVASLGFQQWLDECG